MERKERIVKEVVYTFESEAEFNAFYKLLSAKEDSDFICWRKPIFKIQSYEAIEDDNA